MLSLRSHCEGCAKALPPEARDAMICSFECTFCEVCAFGRLANVCPNCGGNFAFRPIRPKEKLARFPGSTEPPPRGVNMEAHRKFVERYGLVLAENR